MKKSQKFKQSLNPLLSWTWTKISVDSKAQGTVNVYSILQSRLLSCLLWSWNLPSLSYLFTSLCIFCFLDPMSSCFLIYAFVLTEHILASFLGKVFMGVNFLITWMWQISFEDMIDNLAEYRILAWKTFRSFPLELWKHCFIVMLSLKCCHLDSCFFVYSLPKLLGSILTLMGLNLVASA